MNITFPEPFKIFGGTSGSAKWDEDHSHLGFICPCGCDSYIHLPVLPTARGWTWDGNVEKPTLTPSILNFNCKWHGFLTAGVWVKC